MKTTKDYSASAAPQFDAVEDVKSYFGERWPTVTKLMAGVKDREQFTNWASFAGVDGFPVKAWYEHYHGQGSWDVAGLAADYKAKHGWDGDCGGNVG